MKESTPSSAKIKSEIARVWDYESTYYDESAGHGVKTEDEKQLWMEAFSSVLANYSAHPVFLTSLNHSDFTDIPGLSGRKPLRVLDVGCGTGEMGLILTDLGCDVTGIDLSRQMIKTGIEKSEKNGLYMKFLTGDAEQLPFKAESFDIIVTRHLLWTLPSPETALSDWNRILKQKGVLMVIDGVWDDGTVSTKIKKNLSSKIADILKPNRHDGKGYSPDIKEVLPHGGGVPGETARKYLAGAGFCEISIISLENIRKNQRKRLLWYEKIMTGRTYYLISGKKHDLPFE